MKQAQAMDKVSIRWQIKCRKAILSTASDVFEAMFRYDEQNSKNPTGKDHATKKNPILVPDIEIEAFKAMLTFAYMKRFNGLNANNWLDVLMTDLLCEILERDQLRISEIEIWNAALRWSDEQCRQKGIECSAENRGKMLDPILSNIRFPLIPKVDFTKSVVPTGVLTTEEVISVYQHYSHQNLSDVPGLFPLKFPTHQRYKNGETIEMEIEKVSEFALEEKYSRRRSSDAVDIWGFSCAIEAEIRTKDESNEKCLGFYLFYVGPKEENLSFQSSAALRIVSQKNGTEDLIGRRSNDIFNKEWSSRGFHNFISFAELLDPSKGFYNKKEDNVKLAIDVIIDEPKTEKFISDPNKSNGTISMEIEKLSEFAREGFPWKIMAEIRKKNESTEKWLGFFLLSDDSERDGNWSRKCSATLRIVSQKSDVEDFKREFDRTYIFNNNSNNWGFVNFISFAELMDPSKGFYNEDEDKITLAIDFTFFVTYLVHISRLYLHIYAHMLAIWWTVQVPFCAVLRGKMTFKREAASSNG
ncbi:hypothetical protein niasHS_004685 [Heterodera schachtii]|uniref:BTB domain-containing protein n=1 Tax=Heterodera schachtii TaxID=97005 RepID=A0ABD2JSE2_HETSC